MAETIRVRITSGKQTGQVLNMPKAEAEAALATGFAEVAPVEAEPVKAEKKREQPAAPPPNQSVVTPASRAAAAKADVPSAEKSAPRERP